MAGVEGRATHVIGGGSGEVTSRRQASGIDGAVCHRVGLPSSLQVVCCYLTPAKTRIGPLQALSWRRRAAAAGQGRPGRALYCPDWDPGMALDAPLATHPVHLARAPHQRHGEVPSTSPSAKSVQQATLASPLSSPHGSERALGFHNRGARCSPLRGTKSLTGVLHYLGAGAWGELPATELQLLASLPQISSSGFIIPWCSRVRAVQ